MEFIKDLSGSQFLAIAVALVLFIAGSIALTYLAKKSEQLKPIGAGLKLIVVFICVQVFLHLGASNYYPGFAKHLNFYSWLIFTFGVLRLILYIYGDLFVIRRKGGSFPAAFKNTITVAVLIVVVLVLLKEILSINVTSLIATTTVLTATIGLAFQSTLANMLAGLTIYLEKPLKQGDWIAVDGYEGRVLDIMLRSTRILTIENNEVFIPNSRVLNHSVVNYSLPDPTVVRKLNVGVSYSIAPNKVKNAVLEVLSAVPGIAKGPAPVIRVAGYGDFSIDYEIRYPLINFSTYLDTEAEIMNLLWYQFKRKGIEIPYPIRNVTMTQVTEESRLSEQQRRANEIMGLMEKVEILTPLSKTELKKLVDRLIVLAYAAGEVPVKQGEAGDSFYIIKKGRVEVVVEKSSHENAVVAVLGPGDFFGEMSLLTGEVRTASIRVKEDAEFIVIDKESFRSTLANNPSIADSLSRILSDRQAGLEAGRERLGAAAFEMRKKDVSNRMLSKIKVFFGLIK